MINAENQKLFKSLTDKCYISLIIYLNMHFKPNIDLKLQIQPKPELFSLIHMPLLLTPNAPYISINQKSHVKMKSMLKIKNFSNRLQTNAIYDLQYILRCISSQTSTSNSKYYWNRTYFHPSICLYSLHPISHRVRIRVTPIQTPVMSLSGTYHGPFICTHPTWRKPLPKIPCSKVKIP